MKRQPVFSIVSSSDWNTLRCPSRVSKLGTGEKVLTLKTLGKAQGRVTQACMPPSCKRCPVLEPHNTCTLLPLHAIVGVRAGRTALRRQHLWMPGSQALGLGDEGAGASSGNGTPVRMGAADARGSSGWPPPLPTRTC